MLEIGSWSMLILVPCGQMYSFGKGIYYNGMFMWLKVFFFSPHIRYLLFFAENPHLLRHKRMEKGRNAS
jgi:hypothetical protein